MWISNSRSHDQSFNCIRWNRWERDGEEKRADGIDRECTIARGLIEKRREWEGKRERWEGIGRKEESVVREERGKRRKRRWRGESVREKGRQSPFPRAPFRAYFACYFDVSWLFFAHFRFGSPPFLIPHSTYRFPLTESWVVSDNLSYYVYWLIPWVSSAPILLYIVVIDEWEVADHGGTDFEWS